MSEVSDGHQIMVALCSLGPEVECNLKLTYSEASVMLATAYRIRFVLQRNLAMNARSNQGGTMEVPAEIIEYDHFLSAAIAQLCVSAFSYPINLANLNGSAVIYQSSKVVEFRIKQHPRIAWFLVVGLLDNLLDRDDSLANNPYAVHWRSQPEALRELSINLSKGILCETRLARHELLMTAWWDRLRDWRRRLNLDGLLNHDGEEKR